MPLNYRELHKAANVAEAFRGAATNFVTRGKNLRVDVQQAALSALEHMQAHGDYSSTAIVLMDAVKAGMGKNMEVALGRWFIEFSWLGSVDGKKLTKMKDKTIRVEAAEAKNWWEMEPDAPAKPFDANAKIETLVSAIAKEAGKDGATIDLPNVAQFGIAKFIELGKVSKLEMIERLVAGLDIDSKNDVLALVTNDIQSVVAEATAEPEAVAA